MPANESGLPKTTVLIDQPDELIDLSFFTKSEPKPKHSPEYLSQFTFYAYNFDASAKSDNLKVFEADEPSGGVVLSQTSLNSFKTIYADQPFPRGTRNYFEIRFLHGCNFKVGVSLSNDVVENAFCDSSDGYGLYSAGCLRNGSKT